ncbi:hypothetical protein FBU59_001626 [Linderina macrospora]|uniref:Uncharacterized protein n=1 Tax=Linderina macrospora TaxID=4868 RepID=A0ACC1JDP5_9FUNG|nr:hypothetical protein FBU59_001626 [Linderina macrospora]
MGLIRTAYMQWKSLRFPWRRDVFRGTDLDGNMYFERAFKVGSRRTRRHVMYKENFAVSEFRDDRIPVQWQAWMRHTRVEAPAVTELLADIERRRRMDANVRMLQEQEELKAIGDSRQKTFQTSAPGEDYQPEGWAQSDTPTRRGQ